MPRPIFEDSFNHAGGVRYDSLRPGDNFLEFPNDHLNRAWGKSTSFLPVDGRYQSRRESDGYVRYFDNDATVYPVAIKMVRADAPGCDATKQIVEDAQALRAELDAAKGQYAALKREVERTADARNVWMGAAQDHKADADKLRAELAKAKTSKEEAERRVRAVSTDLGWMTLARNNWMAAHDRAADERDAWKARAEALIKSVICTESDGHYCRIDRLDLWYSSADVALSSYERSHNIPPAPTTTNPEQVTKEKKGGGL